MEDLGHLKSGRIKVHDLVTLRIGELIRDNINNKLVINAQELIKIREKKVGGGCTYYDEKNRVCNIYEHRPVQCSAQACWDEKEFMRAYDGPKPVRKDVFDDAILLRLMEAHEKKCSYRALETLVRQIETEGEKAVQAIIELLRFDHQIRPFVSKKMEIDLKEMGLLFGRPLTETILMFGLQVTREPDGSFFLSPHSDA